ncbi:MAG TPA: XRE family transcriptional regulator [Pyrinomonadaceae bacterium]|nr:XRE family transcriptional regulator [Pyrinomonadaceae bacterium]
MKSEKLEIVKGSGNVFRDLGHKNADADQLKAILAAELIKALDCDGLSVRGAQGRTGIAAADFSRIRSRAIRKQQTSEIDTHDPDRLGAGVL